MMKAQMDDTGMVAQAFDPRIKYPCYKSLDEFIDVERLKSLDSYIAERIRRHIEAQTDTLFLNAHRLDATSPYQPGAREIWLTRTRPGVPYNYLDLDRTELWQRTEAAEEFSELMSFVETLPFEATGRILIMYDNAPHEVPAHRDHLQTDVCNEFIWFRTNLDKRFYMYNHETGEKLYVETYSAWFDSVNQFHGADAQDGLTYSLRVDGRFTPDFKARIPRPAYNAASTPALWASVEQ